MASDFFSSTKRPKRRSISRTLTVLLTATVVVVSISVVSALYFLGIKEGRTHLSEKADEYIEALAGVLEIPLWNLDSRNVEKIGEAYAQNDLLETLIVTDNSGHVYYQLQRDSGAPLVSRSRPIRHEDQEIGHVAMALTTKFEMDQNRRVLLSGIGLLVVVILVLATATRLFFKSLLGKLLLRLDTIADAYASGTYDPSRHHMPFHEFQPLLRILGDMRDNLNAQHVEIRNAEKKYRSIFENAVEGIFQTNPDGSYMNVNPALARMLGYESPEELESAVTDIGSQLYLEPERREEFILRLRSDGEVSGFQTRMKRKDGAIAWASLHARSVFDAGGNLSMIEGIVQDITKQKEAEEIRYRLEQQLQQAQKMEAVGRLAGGIAHDFNNMLGIILGYSDMILEDLPPQDPNHEKIEEIRKAADRSAILTRQLLAFARKQTVEPKVLNLNTTVSGMLKMLGRLIGEDINLVWRPGASLSPIKIDPSQIDQILANLCVNARDAISGTGTITIETMNETLDDAYCNRNLETVPGDYVMLSVSDSGIGMDETILGDIFEPFFTTKGEGKGTGLGLATVYGIVKQNNGTINVSSKPGQGTTFRICLPGFRGDAVTVQEISDEAITSGDETILLVEDEASVLYLVKTMLTKLGYRVMATGTPGEAIRLAENHVGDIHLIITDVIMPEMNGRDLSDRLIAHHSGAKCLFMSGYTSEFITQQGTLEQGVHLLKKPFTQKELGAKVRSVLDATI